MTQPNTQDEPMKHKSIYDNPGVFEGTNVKFKTFWDYLETEKGMEAFHKDFPKVQRNQTMALMKDRSQQLEESILSCLEAMGTHLQKSMESNDSLSQRQDEVRADMDSFAEQLGGMSQLVNEAREVAHTVVRQFDDILKPAPKWLIKGPANKPSVPTPKGSGPNDASDPPPAAAPAPETAGPDVIELYPDNATRDLTLRLSERDYAELRGRTAEGGFSSLQVYFNYLLVVGEKVIANRLTSKRPFSGAEGEKGSSSFDDLVVAAVRDEPRFVWLRAVLDDWLLPKQKKEEST